MARPDGTIPQTLPSVWSASGDRAVRLRGSGASRASPLIQLANGSATHSRPRRSPTVDRHFGLGVFRGLRACAIQDAFDSKVEQENPPTLYTCRCLLRGRSASARPKNIYRGFLAGLLLCLSLTLLTILDKGGGRLDFATTERRARALASRLVERADKIASGVKH